MSDRHRLLRLFSAICLVSTLGGSMSADAGFLGFGGDSWKEEVLLHDGSKIIVARTVERGGGHEIGQKPPIREQRLTFNLPSTNENITWEDKFTEDVGGANFLPMLLDVRKDMAYLVVHPMGSLSYMKWGSPNPPYVVFKYQNKRWNRITLQELPMELTIPNLIFSSPDDEAKKVGQRIISAEAIKRLYDSYRQPEFKTILRTPIDYGPPRLEYKGPKAPHPITPPATIDGKQWSHSHPRTAHCQKPEDSMANEIEYALMADRVYQSTRATINWLPDLQSLDWTEFFHQQQPSGFEAISFVKGTNIVISFAGTGSREPRMGTLLDFTPRWTL